MTREDPDRSIVTPTITRLTTIMVCLLLLVSPLSAEAAAAGTAPRVGVLLAGSPPTQGETDALRQVLRELGYVEGRTITIESRWAE